MKRLFFLAVLACFVVLAHRGFAAPFEADLGETMEALAPNGEKDGVIPPNAPELTRHPIPAVQIQPLLDELPGRPFHKLDPPPESPDWWKYPVYGVVGLPRDLVDGMMGVISFVPILNVPIVGGAYEVIPTQLLFRDPRDWHKWPGKRNKNGHGFVDSEGWGWFPTLDSMKFTKVSQRKIDQYESENEMLTAELQERNQQIEANNRASAERQTNARMNAIAAIDKGDGPEAVAWALPYYLAFPNDETAHAVAVNALALDLQGGPDWIGPYLWTNLSNATLSVLRQSETLVAKSHADHPESFGLTKALVYMQTRTERYEQAMVTAQAAFKSQPKDTARARLYFETAMTARNAEAAGEAFKALQGSTTPEVQQLQLRLALLQGRASEARPGLAQLAAAAPDNPYYHYYLGCADLDLVANSETPEKTAKAAFDELEKSAMIASTPALQDRVARTLNYARALTGGDAAKRKPSTKKGLIDLKPGVGGQPVPAESAPPSPPKAKTAKKKSSTN